MHRAGEKCWKIVLWSPVSVETAQSWHVGVVGLTWTVWSMTGEAGLCLVGKVSIVALLLLLYLCARWPPTRRIEGLRSPQAATRWSGKTGHLVVIMRANWERWVTVGVVCVTK